MPKKALQKAKDELLNQSRTIPISRPVVITDEKKEEPPVSPALDWRAKILQARQKPQEIDVSAILAPLSSSHPSSSSAPEEDHFWLPEDTYDGQLAVDVIQTPEAIILQSAVAGVRAEDLEISITNDMITIRGTRQRTLDVPSEHYLYQECYWGGFSRSIILPFPVQHEQATATLDHGILTILLPKSPQQHNASIPITELSD